MILKVGAHKAMGRGLFWVMILVIGFWLANVAYIDRASGATSSGLARILAFGLTLGAIAASERF